MPRQPYLFLDPRNAAAEAAGSYPPTTPLPPHVRQFGYVPDESLLLPGDLVLTSAINPSFGSRAIINVQTDGGHDPEDARWHHAAVYLGEMVVCEAQVWGGVRITSLYDYVGGHLLRFRRDPNLSGDDRWKLVVHAMYRLSDPYSVWALVRLWFQSQIGFWHPYARYKSVEALVCSELYSKAYTLTTGKLLVRGTLGITIPAALSFTPLLTDMHVTWLRIV